MRDFLHLAHLPVEGPRGSLVMRTWVGAGLPWIPISALLMRTTPVPLLTTSAMPTADSEPEPVTETVSQVTFGCLSHLGSTFAKCFAFPHFLHFFPKAGHFCLFISCSLSQNLHVIILSRWCRFWGAPCLTACASSTTATVRWIEALGWTLHLGQAQPPKTSRHCSVDICIVHVLSRWCQCCLMSCNASFFFLDAFRKINKINVTKQIEFESR